MTTLATLFTMFAAIVAAVEPSASLTADSSPWQKQLTDLDHFCVPLVKESGDPALQATLLRLRVEKGWIQEGFTAASKENSYFKITKYSNNDSFVQLAISKKNLKATFCRGQLNIDETDKQAVTEFVKKLLLNRSAVQIFNPYKFYSMSGVTVEIETSNIPAPGHRVMIVNYAPTKILLPFPR